MTEFPLVSVCMITYNHEQFIKRAIEGVLNQECDFEIELVVVNDCSTDSTNKIIKDIISKHKKGSSIKYVNNNVNKGMLANFAFALNSCQGNYIAICEGDDYWVNKDKLQIQVDYLQKNREFVLIGHNARLNKGEVEETKLIRNSKLKHEDIFSSDLVKRNPFVTSMTIFRNIGFNNIIKTLANFNVGDWPLFTLMSFHGKCRFFYEPVGFYRVHSGSVTFNNRINYSQFKNELINRINHAQYWNNYSNGKFIAEEEQIKSYRSRTLVNLALKNNDFKTAIFYSQYIKIKDLKKYVSKIVVKTLKIIFKLKKLTS